MSVAKDELYRLIEALLEKETPVVKRFLEFILIRVKIYYYGGVKVDEKLYSILKPYDNWWCAEEENLKARNKGVRLYEQKVARVME